jgi:hypothetical protein
VQNNVYVGVANPLQEDTNGNMLALGNLFTSTTGSKAATGSGFEPSYSLDAEPTTELEAKLRSEVGPH